MSNGLRLNISTSESSICIKMNDMEHEQDSRRAVLTIVDDSLRVTRNLRVSGISVHAGVILVHRSTICILQPQRHAGWRQQCPDYSSSAAMAS
jgi:hypothetical protein